MTPSSCEAGDLSACLGRVLTSGTTESSLGLVDPTEKLIMHFQVLVKESAPGSE